MILQQDALVAAVTAHAERNGWHLAGGMQGAREVERQHGRYRFGSLAVSGSVAGVDLSQDTPTAERGT